jgi:cytochrome b6-f complex iron-sulfur subunit
MRFLAPPGDANKEKKVTLAKRDIPAGTSRIVLFDEKPVIVINHQGKGYIALSKVCTHLGCLVEFDMARNLLICPCHAGTYDLEGNVLSGPPPRPLLKIPLKVEGELLVIG